MDIVKAAMYWGRAEMFSAQFFILFAIIFLIASAGFWQLGKTGMAKAYIFPMLVCGMLLLAIGLGLFFTNKARVASFETAYQDNPSLFIQSEITRAEQTVTEYTTIVFKIIPVIIIVAALIFIVIDTPIWRAISTSTIAIMIVIMLVDINANARMEAYQEQLELVEKDTDN